MPGSEEEITWTYTQQQEDTSNATDFNEVMNDLVPAAKCQYICGFQCPILEKDPEAASLDSCYIYIYIKPSNILKTATWVWVTDQNIGFVVGRSAPTPMEGTVKLLIGLLVRQFLWSTLSNFSGCTQNYCNCQQGQVRKPSLQPIGLQTRTL